CLYFTCTCVNYRKQIPAIRFAAAVCRADRMVAPEIASQMAKLPPPDPRLIRLAPVLQEAVGLHRAGRFAEASELYRRVLKKMPDHFDALYSFALMRMQEGAAQDALALISKAVKVEPRAAPAHC